MKRSRRLRLRNWLSRRRPRVGVGVKLRGSHGSCPWTRVLWQRHRREASHARSGDRGKENRERWTEEQIYSLGKSLLAKLTTEAYFHNHLSRRRSGDCT